ncbi:hypothetical protein [Vasconcelosia minhoensis]|nr:hypothetical protein [Romeria gracilis]
MRVLTGPGQLTYRNFPDVQQWFEPRYADSLSAGTLDETDCQRSLWEMAQSSREEASLAQLSLRCWVSYQIEAACNQLARQFGEAYSFTQNDLWRLVMDDDGRTSSDYTPVTVKILNQYDPAQSGLRNWTYRLTKSNSDINAFLKEQGLYRISPWAILNDTKLPQLPKVLPHLSRGELTAAGRLLNAYHQVYRRDRIANRQAGRGRRCEDPTDEQLRRINPNEPANVVFSQLSELAEQLRQYRIAARRGSPQTQSLDRLERDAYDREDLTADDGEQVQDEFLQQYRDNFVAALDASIQAIVQVYVDRYQKRRPPQGQIYCQALELFHCQGLSMAEIARQVGLSSQVQVTRLLQLRRLRAEVLVHWLNQLKQQTQAKALNHISPERLNAIAQQLDQVLTEETEAVMDAAQAEAQMPKNRTSNSLFARRLCYLLANIILPPP